MSAIRVMTSDDVGWSVEVLARRRARLARHAPVYWRPAADATERHTRWLTHLLGPGGGIGYRTERGLLIAAPGPDAWTIDDAWVPDDAWHDDGAALWSRAVARIGPATVRFVCPTFEPERTRFAVACGLELDTSWWHLDVDPATEEVEPATEAGTEPLLEGASAALVPAPPVYDPGGPVLLLREIADIVVLDGAPGEAARCGAPLVVVDQPSRDAPLARSLTEHGYLRHCDFFTGTLA